MWSTECYNQLTSSYGKIILAGWRASGIFAALEDDLIGFLIDSFNKIDPFGLAIEIKMTSVIRPKEKVFNDYDSDEEFCNSENLDFNKL